MVEIGSLGPTKAAIYNVIADKVDQPDHHASSAQFGSRSRVATEHLYSSQYKILDDRRQGKELIGDAL